MARLVLFVLSSSESACLFKIFYSLIINLSKDALSLVDNVNRFKRKLDNSSVNNDCVEMSNGNINSIR